MCESGLSHIRGQKEEETNERDSEVISDVTGKPGMIGIPELEWRRYFKKE